mgnify:CR=1 FL=1
MIFMKIKRRIERMSKWFLLFVIFPLQGYTQDLRSDSVHIDLKKAIEIALSENPSIRIAEREVHIKKYTKAEQMVSLFPNAALVGSYNRTLKKQVMTMDFGGQVMEIEVGTDNNYSAGLNFSMPIINASLWNSIKLSEMDVEMAFESARASRLSLISEVKKAYYSMLFAKEAYDVLQKNYDNVSLTYETVLNKYNQGMASEFEKLRAEVQLKNQRPSLLSAKSNLAFASMMLKVMIGLEVNEPIVFEGNLSDFEETVKNNPLPNIDSLSLENNSNLLQMQLAEKQLEKTKNIIISSACPTLSLSGNYQYTTMNNNFKFADYKWNPYSVIGLNLSIPLVSWASTAYKVQSGNLRIENIKDQRLALERNLKISINNSIIKINNAIEELESNKETMLQAEKAYQISLKQYEIGMSTWLDLSSAELAYTSAKLTYNQSIYTYLSAYAELEETIGKE